MSTFPENWLACRKHFLQTSDSRLGEGKDLAEAPGTQVKAPAAPGAAGSGTGLEQQAALLPTNPSTPGGRACGFHVDPVSGSLLLAGSGFQNFMRGQVWRHQAALSSSRAGLAGQLSQHPGPGSQAPCSRPQPGLPLPPNPLRLSESLGLCQAREGLNPVASESLICV